MNRPSWLSTGLLLKRQNWNIILQNHIFGAVLLERTLGNFIVLSWGPYCSLLSTLRWGTFGPPDVLDYDAHRPLPSAVLGGDSVSLSLKYWEGQGLTTLDLHELAVVSSVGLCEPLFGNRPRWGVVFIPSVTACLTTCWSVWLPTFTSGSVDYWVLFLLPSLHHRAPVYTVLENS